MIYCHLQAMIRTLDLHYSGVGWQILREAFRKYCPQDNELFAYWMGRHWVQLKAFLRMKFNGLYRDLIYGTIPNLILYEGEARAREQAWWPAREVQ